LVVSSHDGYDCWQYYPARRITVRLLFIYLLCFTSKYHTIIALKKLGHHNSLIPRKNSKYQNSQTHFDQFHVESCCAPKGSAPSTERFVEPFVLVNYQKLFRCCLQHWLTAWVTKFVLSVCINFAILAEMVSRVVSSLGL
jgi:hypothetical protein